MSDWLIDLGDSSQSPDVFALPETPLVQDSDPVSPPAGDFDPIEPIDPGAPPASGPNWYDGSDGGGYPGGPTPDGYTPHEDGTGRFMYDGEGRIHINPYYAEWLNDPEQEIDWGGVFLDLAVITGVSVGLLPFHSSIVIGGWLLSAHAEFMLDHRAVDTSP